MYRERLQTSSSKASTADAPSARRATRSVTGVSPQNEPKQANVTVCVRVRPLVEREVLRGDVLNPVWKVEEDGTIIITKKGVRSGSSKMAFERVFREHHTTEDVYEGVGAQVRGLHGSEEYWWDMSQSSSTSLSVLCPVLRHCSTSNAFPRSMPRGCPLTR